MERRGRQDMNKLNDIKAALAKHKPEIQREFKVKKIGIFGSYTKGRQKKKSDIDVLVEFSEPIGLFKFMDLEEYLQNLFGVKVDLVSRKALKPHIGERILREVVYI
jgi:predicted nucleotidyltransferase